MKKFLKPGILARLLLVFIAGSAIGYFVKSSHQKPFSSLKSQKIRIIDPDKVPDFAIADVNVLKPLDMEYEYEATNRFYGGRLARAKLSLAYKDINSPEEYASWRKLVVAKAGELLNVNYADLNRYQGEFDVLETFDLGEAIAKKVLFPSVTGLRVPGILFLPKLVGQSAPAVIVYHGHGIGKADTASQKGSYQKAAALFFVSKGYVVLTYDHPGFGELEFYNHRMHIQRGILLGKPAMGDLVTDALKAVKLIENIKLVDPKRINVAGVSLGGEIAFYTSLFNQNINAAVVSGFFNSFKGTFFDAPHCLCAHIPGVLDYFDIPDLAAAIAPRPMLLQHGVGDTIFSAKHAQELLPVVNKSYQLLDAEENLQLLIHKGAHEMIIPEAVEFLEKHNK